MKQPGKPIRCGCTGPKNALFCLKNALKKCKYVADYKIVRGLKSSK